MSGGHFDYMQYRISDIATMIDELIASNDTPDEDGYSYNYTPDTINKFLLASATLKVAAKMAQRIDWLVSGDDSEESFHERWSEELKGECEI